MRFLGARGKVGNNPIFFEVILHEMRFIEVIEVLFSPLKILSKLLILWLPELDSNQRPGD